MTPLISSTTSPHTFDAWAFREIQHLEPRLLTRTDGVMLTHPSAVSELPALCEPKGADVLELLQREEVLEGRPGEVQLGKLPGDVVRHEHLQCLEACGGQLERVRGERVCQRLAEVCATDTEQVLVAFLVEGSARALLPELRSSTCGE